MIFKALDFHVLPDWGEVPNDLFRRFRLRVNPIVDSFSMRIPRKTKTELFHKLNVQALPCSQYGQRFWELEGIGNVELVVPDIASIYHASQPQTVAQVQELLLKGIRVAAQHDALFTQHMKVWQHLLATSSEEFDFDLRIARSHRSRRWRCNAVLRVGPHNYQYDVLVKDTKTGQTIQRHRIKATECLFPFYRGIGFADLRWDGEQIIVLTKEGDQVARFETDLPV
jgi:hypothetical protein